MSNMERERRKTESEGGGRNSAKASEKRTKKYEQRKRWRREEQRKRWRGEEQRKALEKTKMPRIGNKIVPKRWKQIEVLNKK